MPSFVMRGPFGAIYQAWHKAAQLTDWTLSRDGAGLILSASVSEADTFRLSQPALTFRVDRQTGSPWTWPILTLQIADGALRAQLEPQE